MNIAVDDEQWPALRVDLDLKVALLALSLCREDEREQAGLDMDFAPPLAKHFDTYKVRTTFESLAKSESASEALVSWKEVHETHWETTKMSA